MAEVRGAHHVTSQSGRGFWYFPVFVAFFHKFAGAKCTNSSALPQRAPDPPYWIDSAEIWRAPSKARTLLEHSITYLRYSIFRYENLLFCRAASAFTSKSRSVPRSRDLRFIQPENKNDRFYPRFIHFEIEVLPPGHSFWSKKPNPNAVLTVNKKSGMSDMLLSCISRYRL